jgi:predicted Zn-dependent peptidase
VIREEVASFADSNYATDQELMAARNRVIVEDVYRTERIGTLGSWAGYFWAVAGLEYYLRYRTNVRAVTRSDIARYARAYFVRRPYVTGVLLSPAARAAHNLTREAFLPQETTP